jgi:mannosyltransferase OCH1-like enzyme
MPEAFAAYGRQWAELHTGWEIRDWRDSTALPPLRNQDLFDRAREVCPKDWKRLQADLLRLELLWQFGGVYADTDVEPLRPFDDLLDRGVLVGWSPNRGQQGKRLLTQAVLGAESGHPFIGACIGAVPGSVRRYRGQHLAKMVGPHMVSRVWEQQPHGVVPLPERTLFPQSIKDRDAGKTADLDGAYAWHRWNTTLRKQGKGLG